MFGLMKNVVKEPAVPADPLTLANLHTGCVIGFGFMQQKSISGKRMPIIEANSYLFDSDSFVSYRLENDSASVTLIVADEEDPKGTYLALSQRIEPRLFDAIFGEETRPAMWFSLSEGDPLGATPPVLGPSQGWLTTAYTLVMSSSGRLLEGDWRLRNPAEHARLSRPFEYVLLVDEENEFALEAEKHEDGSIHVFSTIYCPATDIGEIARGFKSSSAPVAEKPQPSLVSVEKTPQDAPVSVEPAKEEAVKEIAPEEKVLLQEIKEEKLPEAAAQANLPEEVETKAPEVAVPEVAVAEEEPAVLPEATSVSANDAAIDSALKQSVKAVEPFVETAPAVAAAQTEEAKTESAMVLLKDLSDLKETPVAEQKASVAADGSQASAKFGRIQTAASDTAPLGEALACDVGLASRLISEAQRNQMLLSELIRKVIDLPARVQDQVFIPFAMSDAEVAELARRYNLPAGDATTVKAQILQELKRFVGEKN